MPLSLKYLMNELIVESAFGKKFPIKIIKNGKISILVGMATANIKPNERPYRITWFYQNFSDNRHVDLSLEEMLNILQLKIFPPDIIQRIHDKYPDSDLIGDKYIIL